MNPDINIKFLEGEKKRYEELVQRFKNMADDQNKPNDFRRQAWNKMQIALNEIWEIDLKLEKLQKVGGAKRRAAPKRRSASKRKSVVKRRSAKRRMSKRKSVVKRRSASKRKSVVKRR